MADKKTSAGTEDPNERDDDLLGEVGNTDGSDLLGEVVEDDSEGWVPQEAGEGVQGTVLKVGETRSDFSDQMAPTVTVQTKDGSKLRIIGYGAVLRRELYDSDPQPGDLIAVKYFGEKAIKKGKWAGKNYRHFGVAVRRAQGQAS
ncbi:MAG: hypothetical protein ACRDQA_07485 [Nocardioidaceae bacterium]